MTIRAAEAFELEVREASCGAPASSPHRRGVDLADPGSRAFWIAELSRQLDAAMWGMSPYLPYALMNLRRHIEAMRHVYEEDLDALDVRLSVVTQSVDAILIDAGYSVDALEAILLEDPWPEPISPEVITLARRDLERIVSYLWRAHDWVEDAIVEHHWRDLGDGG